MRRSDYFAIGAILVCSVFFGALLGHFLIGPVSTLGAQGNEYTALQPEYTYASFNPEILPPYTEAEILPEPPLQPPGHKYVVTVQDGYIVVLYAVQGNKAAEIKTATGISVAALPPEEQERLTQGINVYDEDTLFRILEDYGS